MVFMLVAIGLWLAVYTSTYYYGKVKVDEEEEEYDLEAQWPRD